MLFRSLGPALLGLSAGACHAQAFAAGSALSAPPAAPPPSSPGIAPRQTFSQGLVTDLAQHAAAAQPLNALEPPATETPQELRGEEASLAKQLANPVASLISVPFQFNFDRGIGPNESIQRANLNIQPVVPFKLSAD